MADTGRDLVAVAALDTSLILNPATGEIADANDPEQVVDILTALRELQTQVYEQRKNAEFALAVYAKTLGTKTFEIGDHKIEVSPEQKLDYDSADIEILEQLLELGLPDERWNKLVRQEVVSKVDGRVARQLASANDAYAEVIDKAVPIKQVPLRVLVK